jgi:hypothetical protein
MTLTALCDNYPAEGSMLETEGKSPTVHLLLARQSRH